MKLYDVTLRLNKEQALLLKEMLAVTIQEMEPHHEYDWELPIGDGGTSAYSNEEKQELEDVLNSLCEAAS